MPVGPRIGMGPVAYQTSPIRKCDERVVGTCVTANPCCAVIACTYCLEWLVYGEEPVKGTAKTADDGSLKGQVDGREFYAEWRRDEYTNQCYLWVFYGGQLVIVIPLCDDLITCRDYSYSAAVTLEDEYGTSGTLTWTRFEMRPVEYRLNASGCKMLYCGTCECSVKRLCVDIDEVPDYYYLPGNTQYRGDIGDVADACDPPLWQGTVEGYHIAVRLGYDSYNHCVLSGTIAGEEFDPVIIDNCAAIDVTFELASGTKIRLRSMTCEDCKDQPGACQCGRPFGNSVTIRFSSENETGTIHSTTLNFSDSILVPGIQCPQELDGVCYGYEGQWCGSLAIPMGGHRNVCIEFKMVCSLLCGGFCLYSRYSDRDLPDTAPYYGWCRMVSVGDCECPATLLYTVLTNIVGNCPGSVWGYQVNSFLVTESEANCA